MRFGRGLSARRGHAFAVQLHGVELQKERSEQNSRAPRAHRRIFTTERQPSSTTLRVAMTSAHSKARRL